MVRHEIELFQFPASHFNEKVRWALDWKRVPHERISLVPGPHAARMRKLSGQTATPVLRDRGQVIAGSARILEHLERRFPEPALHPRDPDDLRRALAIQREFDEEVGPAVRLAKFFQVMSADYATRVFGDGLGPLGRAAYRASFPLVRRVMWRKMGIDADSAVRAGGRTLQALDFVAKTAGPSGHLVGERFGLADLACASLLMPAVRVAEWGGPAEPSDAKTDAWFARWADHPGAAWVRDTYRRYRRPPSDP